MNEASPQPAIEELNLDQLDELVTQLTPQNEDKTGRSENEETISLEEQIKDQILKFNEKINKLAEKKAEIKTEIQKINELIAKVNSLLSSYSDFGEIRVDHFRKKDEKMTADDAATAESDFAPRKKRGELLRIKGILEEKLSEQNLLLDQIQIKTSVLKNDIQAIQKKYPLLSRTV